jgi:hypothetical protein
MAKVAVVVVALVCVEMEALVVQQVVETAVLAAEVGAVVPTGKTAQ